MKKALLKDYSFKDKKTYSNDYILYSHSFQRLCTYEKWSKITIFNLYYFSSFDKKRLLFSRKLKDFLQSEPN